VRIRRHGWVEGAFPTASPFSPWAPGETPLAAPKHFLGPLRDRVRLAAEALQKLRPAVRGQVRAVYPAGGLVVSGAAAGQAGRTARSVGGRAREPALENARPACRVGPRTQGQVRGRDNSPARGRPSARILSTQASSRMRRTGMDSSS